MKMNILKLELRLTNLKSYILDRLPAATLLSLYIISLYYLHDMIFLPRSNTVLRFISEHADLNIVIFIPLYVVAFSKTIMAQSLSIIRYISSGVILGLITPIVSFIDTWSPIIFKPLGLYGNRLHSLALESISEHATSCLHKIIPTAIAGAIIWIILFYINNTLIFIFHKAVVPISKSFISWHKDVYKY